MISSMVPSFSPSRLMTGLPSSVLASISRGPGPDESSGAPTICAPPGACMEVGESCMEESPVGSVGLGVHPDLYCGAPHMPAGSAAAGWLPSGRDVLSALLEYAHPAVRFHVGRLHLA